jgi:hypothetical protein
MAREAKVFFYGLFMDPEALKARGFQPSNVKAAFVDGFALQLGQRATLVAAPDRRVYGMLMTLPHHEIDALYSESSVELYLRSLSSHTRATAVRSPLYVSICRPLLKVWTPIPNTPPHCNRSPEGWACRKATSRRSEMKQSWAEARYSAPLKPVVRGRLSRWRNPPLPSSMRRITLR